MYPQNKKIKRTKMNGQGIFKSAIQEALEKKNYINKYIAGVKQLVEDYTIADSVFYFNGVNLSECVNGFFKGERIDENVDNLRDIFESCENPVIRICESDGKVSFEVGEYFADNAKVNRNAKNIPHLYNISKRSYIC